MQTELVTILVSIFETELIFDSSDVEIMVGFLKKYENNILATFILKQILFYRDLDTSKIISRLLKEFIYSMHSRKQKFTSLNEKYLSIACHILILNLLFIKRFRKLQLEF